MLHFSLYFGLLTKEYSLFSELFIFYMSMTMSHIIFMILLKSTYVMLFVTLIHIPHHQLNLILLLCDDILHHHYSFDQQSLQCLNCLLFPTHYYMYCFLKY